MSVTITTGFARATIAVAAVAALAACIKIESKDAKPPASSGDDWMSHLEIGSTGVSYDGDAVVVSNDGAKARIAANGDLTIDGKAVNVDAAQRTALAEYHAAAMHLRSDAKGLGREGVELGKAVVTDVLSGIAKGDTSQIEKNAEARADGLRRAAGRLCEDLATMRGAQDRVTATLAEFRPFATLDQADLDDCRKDTLPKGDAAVAAAEPAGG